MVLYSDTEEVTISTFHQSDALTVRPVPALREVAITVPSSKSHTIRALLTASAADGVSTITNALDSADAQSCIDAVSAFGVRVAITARHATGIDLTVTPPPGGMITGGMPATGGMPDAGRAGDIQIDVGNSGTTLYLLTAIAAARETGATAREAGAGRDPAAAGRGAATDSSISKVCFDGDESVRTRSAAHLLNALRDLGATVTGGDCAPYCVAGPLTPGSHITIESPTSQYLSALLLAAPLIGSGTGEGPLSRDAAASASGTIRSSAPSAPDATERSAASTAPATVIDVALLYEHPYIDMTCWWLDLHGIRYERNGYSQFTVPSGQRYRPFSIALPGDFSSATFWFCAAAITGSPVTVEGLRRDDVQGDREVLSILEDLGCSVTWSSGDGPARASVTVSGRPTRGGTFDLNAMPDALPALAAMACYAPEPILLTNVPQARQKETDRIAVMAHELNGLGGRVTEFPDGIQIEPRVLRGGTAESHGDHRIAMALAVAALGAAAPVTIHGAGAAAVTYPSFFDDLGTIAPEAIKNGAIENGASQSDAEAGEYR